MMTVISKSQHKKDQRRSRSEAWKECGYCESDVHHGSGTYNEELGIWFCDEYCEKFYFEEIVFEGESEAFEHLDEDIKNRIREERGWL